MESKDQDEVLVVEDQPDVARAIEKALSRLYRVRIAKDASQALKALESMSCSSILLDIMLPGVSGYMFCQRIKSDPFLHHIPIIFLTGLDSSEDVVNGLKLGADDYLAKPFKLEELLARLETAIRRSRESLDANPLTKLPGNCFIERTINERIQSSEIFAALYIDINHFKSYNDYYGFHRGDRVIQETARILVDCCKGNGRKVAHLGGDDFIVITADENSAALCEKIIGRFDSAIPTFYDDRDFKNQHISVKNRQGEDETFPLISISIGVVTNKTRPIRTLGEVAAIGAEIKGFAKRHAGSFYAIDRRKDPYGTPQKR